LGNPSLEGDDPKNGSSLDFAKTDRNTDRAPVRNHLSRRSFRSVAILREGGFAMGSTADKASGLANEAIGKIKQGVGSAVGSDKLKAEGAAQELKGDVQKAVGDAKAAVKDGANKAAAAANRNL
jgi:uncharacterized protein YjbJ (UPF0337 family)